MLDNQAAELLKKYSKKSIEELMLNKEYHFIRIISNIAEAAHDFAADESMFEKEEEYDEDLMGVELWNLPSELYDHYSDIHERNNRREYIIEQTISLFNLLDLIKKKE